MYLRRYHDIEISNSGLWRILKRLDLNRLPASQGCWPRSAADRNAPSQLSTFARSKFSATTPAPGALSAYTSSLIQTSSVARPVKSSNQPGQFAQAGWARPVIPQPAITR
jgi:hypothetical protein